MSNRLPARRIIGSLILFGLVGAAIVGLQRIDKDSEAAGPPPSEALAVETKVVGLEQDFTMRRTFSGRVEARRQSELGFELAGRLARIWVDEGTTVEAGQLLAELDSERLAARRDEQIAARVEASAKRSLAKVTFERLRTIVDKGGISPQDLDESRETLHAAQAALALADQRIATIEIELRKSRLVAPFAATVIARVADEGRVVEAGYPILSLQERSAPEIRIGVAGRSLEQLVPGRVYPIVWQGRSLEARLRALLPVRAARARTVDALFDPLDPPAGMLAGDMVTLNLDSVIDQAGSWLPLSALTEGRRGLWSIYVAEPLSRADSRLAATHRIVRRAVSVLYHSGDRVYVQGSVEPRQRVVISGVQRIVPGQAVRLAQVATLGMGSADAGDGLP